MEYEHGKTTITHDALLRMDPDLALRLPAELQAERVRLLVDGRPAMESPLLAGADDQPATARRDSFGGIRRVVPLRPY